MTKDTANQSVIVTVLKEDVPQGYSAPANWCLTTVNGPAICTSCYILDKKFEVEEFLKKFSGR